MISRSEAKRETAMEIGADKFLVSSDAEAMKAAANSLDVIIDTVPVKHDMDPYIVLLDVDGTIAVVGAIGQWAEVNGNGLLFGNRSILGSSIGGMPETQEVLDFCGRKTSCPNAG